MLGGALRSTVASAARARLATCSATFASFRFGNSNLPRHTLGNPRSALHPTGRKHAALYAQPPIRRFALVSPHARLATCVPRYATTLRSALRAPRSALQGLRAPRLHSYLLTLRAPLSSTQHAPRNWLTAPRLVQRASPRRRTLPRRASSHLAHMTIGRSARNRLGGALRSTFASATRARLAKSSATFGSFASATDTHLATRSASYPRM